MRGSWNCNWSVMDELSDLYCANRHSERCSDCVGSGETCDVWEANMPMKGRKHDNERGT